MTFPCWEYWNWNCSWKSTRSPPRGWAKNGLTWNGESKVFLWCNFGRSTDLDAWEGRASRGWPRGLWNQLPHNGCRNYMEDRGGEERERERKWQRRGGLQRAAWKDCQITVWDSEKREDKKESRMNEHFESHWMARFTFELQFSACLVHFFDPILQCLSLSHLIQFVFSLSFALSPRVMVGVEQVKAHLAIITVKEKRGRERRPLSSSCSSNHHYYSRLISSIMAIPSVTSSPSRFYAVTVMIIALV